MEKLVEIKKVHVPKKIDRRLVNLVFSFHCLGDGLYIMSGTLGFVLKLVIFFGVCVSLFYVVSGIQQHQFRQIGQRRYRQASVVRQTHESLVEQTPLVEDPLCTGSNASPEEKYCKIARNWTQIEEENLRLGESFTPNKVHIFTYANLRSNGLCMLASTIQHFGHTLNVMGFDKSDTMFDGTRSVKEQCVCTPLEQPTPSSSNFLDKMISPFTGKKPAEQNCTCTEVPISAIMKKYRWMTYMVEHHDGLGISENDLVMFVDGFDLVAQNPIEPAKEIFKKVMKGRRGVLFSGEKNCFPFDVQKKRGGGWGWMHGRRICVQQRVSKDPEMIDGNQLCRVMSCKAPTKGPYQWINSGAYMGDVLSLQSFFKAAKRLEIDYDMHDDQAIAQLVQVTFPRINVVTDTHSQVWFSLQNFDKGDVPRIDEKREVCLPNYLIDGKPPVNQLTETSAILMHFNGNGKSFQGSCTNTVFNAFKVR